MNYASLLDYLFERKDDNFASFSKRLSNSVYQSIGVKTPILRNFIKEHYQDEDLKLEEFEHHKYLEVDSIYFGIGLLRCKDIDEQLEFLYNNLKFAASWAVTDTLGNYLKKCSFDKFWEFFLNTYQDDYLYTRRFAYVFAIKFSHDEEIIKIFGYIKQNEDYMVTMAEAWLLSFIAIDYPDEVFTFLQNSGSLALKRKTISKICDSFRFDESEKEKFKSLR